VANFKIDELIESLSNPSPKTKVTVLKIIISNAKRFDSQQINKLVEALAPLQNHPRPDVNYFAKKAFEILTQEKEEKQKDPEPIEDKVDPSTTNQQISEEGEQKKIAEEPQKNSLDYYYLPEKEENHQINTSETSPLEEAKKVAEPQPESAEDKNKVGDYEETERKLKKLNLKSKKQRLKLKTFVDVIFDFLSHLVNLGALVFFIYSAVLNKNSLQSPNFIIPTVISSLLMINFFEKNKLLRFYTATSLSGIAFLLSLAFPEALPPIAINRIYTAILLLSIPFVIELLWLESKLIKSIVYLLIIYSFYDYLAPRFKLISFGYHNNTLVFAILIISFTYTIKSLAMFILNFKKEALSFMWGAIAGWTILSLLIVKFGIKPSFETNSITKILDTFKARKTSLILSKLNQLKESGIGLENINTIQTVPKIFKLPKKFSYNTAFLINNTPMLVVYTQNSNSKITSLVFALEKNSVIEKFKIPGKIVVINSKTFLIKKGQTFSITFNNSSYEVTNFASGEVISIGLTLKDRWLFLKDKIIQQPLQNVRDIQTWKLISSFFTSVIIEKNNPLKFRAQFLGNEYVAIANMYRLFQLLKNFGYEFVECSIKTENGTLEFKGEIKSCISNPTAIDLKVFFSGKLFKDNNPFKL